MENDAQPEADGSLLGEFEHYVEDLTQKAWIREYRLSDKTTASLLRAVLSSLEGEDETQEH